MSSATNKTPSPLELFPDIADVAAGTQIPTEHVDIRTVEPDPDNPRTDADGDESESIKKHGVRPLVVTPAGTKLRILDGERRYWGAIKAGLSTIPVQIDRTPYTPIQRIVRQAALNRHRPLSVMDEAKMYKRVQDETSWSEQQIADLFQRKKSTVADRLAIVNMPECFLVHFTGESPLLSAAAAPIIRKYFGVPANILELAGRTAPADPEWERAKKAGKTVELKDVERVLKEIILVDRMRELPEALVLTYRGLGGVSCKVAGVEYAVDVPKFIAAERKYSEEQQRADIEKSKPATGAKPSPADASTDDDDEDSVESVGERHDPVGDLWDVDEDAGSDGSVGKAPAQAPERRDPKPAKPMVSAADRKRISKENAEKEAAALKLDRWRKARPHLLVAIAVALKIAPADAKHPLGEFVSEEVARAVGTDLDAVLKLVPLGTTAQDLVRHLAMLHLYDDLMSDFNYEGIPRRIKELGLKVDVAKVLEKTSKPAAADRSAGTPKRGGRPLTPPAPTNAAKSKPARRAKAPAKKKGKR